MNVRNRNERKEMRRTTTTKADIYDQRSVLQVQTHFLQGYVPFYRREPGNCATWMCA